MLALTRLIITAAFAAATCSSIICSAACDFEPGECLGEAEMFGPCLDGTCAPGLTCRITSQGDVCLPTMRDAIALGAKAEECAEARTSLGMWCNKDWNTCHMPCVYDSHCLGGTVCAEDVEICVYPKEKDDVKPPAGETLGPCLGEDMLCFDPLDTCIVSLTVSGNICGRPYWTVPCNVDTADECPNGQVCALDENVCVWPK